MKVPVQKSAQETAPAGSFKRPTAAAAQDRAPHPSAGGRGTPNPESKEVISPSLRAAPAAAGMAATQSVRVTLAPEEAAAATPDRQPLVEAREPLLPPAAESRRRERGQQATAQSASSATAQVPNLVPIMVFYYFLRFTYSAVQNSIKLTLTNTILINTCISLLPARVVPTPGVGVAGVAILDIFLESCPE